MEGNVTIRALVATASVSAAALLFQGCAGVPTPTVQPAQWQGQWTISGYSERGTATYKYDGKAVRITQNGATYQLATPSGGFFFFPGMRYVASGNRLVGQYVADEDDLEERFSDFPDVVLHQAAASRACVYRATLTMLQDGRIAAEHNNLQISYTRDNRFHHCTSYDGWVRFTLSR